ncbi:hypothetical protein AO383_1999 [Moraxella catarrhalis]|nr:hypothetical protein AO383_1999 [Moraxella catarrhalis]
MTYGTVTTLAFTKSIPANWYKTAVTDGMPALPSKTILKHNVEQVVLALIWV